MTAIAEDLDLDRWVTFSGGDRDACCWRYPVSCSLEAVARAVWDTDCCGDAPNPQPLCAAHRDSVTRSALFSGRQFVCSRTGVTVTLLRIEPIR